MGGNRERAERGAPLDFPRRERQFGGQERHDSSVVRRFDRLWRFGHDRSIAQVGRRAHGPYERRLNSKRSSAEVQSRALNAGPVRDRLGSLTLSCRQVGNRGQVGNRWVTWLVGNLPIITVPRVCLTSHL